MPNYSKLHDLVSHRVTIEYDTGARVTGYLASCQPSAGPVEFVTLSDAKMIDSRGRLLRDFSELTLCPNVLTSIALDEGPLVAPGRREGGGMIQECIHVPDQVARAWTNGKRLASSTSRAGGARGGWCGLDGPAPKLAVHAGRDRPEQEYLRRVVHPHEHDQQGARSAVA